MSRRLRGAATRDAVAQATVTLQVPFHDVDSAGVVWHGHYTKYLEVARSALLDALGYGHARMLASDYHWPVVSLATRYVQPLRLDQRVAVTAALVEHALRLRVRYDLRDAGDGRRIATAETVQVAVRRSDGALCIGLPEEFRRCVPAAGDEAADPASAGMP